MKLKNSDIEKYIKDDYDVSVPDCWEKIKSAEILEDRQEAAQIVQNKKSKFSLIYRIAAAAACLALIVTAAYGIPHLFNNSEQSPIVYGQDTPVRIGELGSMKASFTKPYTFGEAYEEADLVAEVVIVGWLGEIDAVGLGPVTYFRTVIVDEYKDTLNMKEKEFVLLQVGNSRWTFKGYPLFKNGDRFLLSLKSLEDNELDADFKLKDENCFWIVGSQLTEMQVIERNEVKYVLKRNFQNFSDIEYLIKQDSTDIIEYTINQDKALSEAEGGFCNVYLLDEVIDHIKTLK